MTTKTKVKLTNEWVEAHWEEYELALTPAQQQTIAKALEINPELTDSDLLQGLGLEESDVKEQGELIDAGHTADCDDYDMELINDE